MIKKFLQLGYIKLFALSLCTVMLFHITAAGAAFVKESIHRKNGRLETQYAHITDFVSSGLVPKENNSYVSSDTDPQIILEVNGSFTGITVEMTAAMAPGRLVAYYTTRPDAPFSEKNILWLTPVKDEQNLYRVSLPEKYIHTLRIDPTEFAGNRLVFGKIMLNDEKTAADYLQANHITLTYMAVYTCLLAATLGLIQEILQKSNIKATKK